MSREFDPNDPGDKLSWDHVPQRIKKGSLWMALPWAAIIVVMIWVGMCRG